MAQHKSALKRIRQNQKRYERNRLVKTSMRTAIKKVNMAVANNDGTAAQAAMHTAISLIDKAASKGVIHPNTAARNVSRLTLRVNKLLRAQPTTA
jgi:small subunit ribosomal protein S20